MLDDIKAIIPEKISNDNNLEGNDGDEEAKKSKDYVYDQILALFQRQNNVIQILQDRVKMQEQEKKESEEQKETL